MKKIPTGVGEAGDDAWSREIPPPSSRSLELYSGGGRRSPQLCNHKVHAEEQECGGVQIKQS